MFNFYAIWRRVSNRFGTYFVSRVHQPHMCVVIVQSNIHTMQKQTKKHADFRVHLASLCNILYVALFLTNCFINSICDAIANAATAELNIVCRVHLYFTQFSDSPASSIAIFTILPIFCFTYYVILPNIRENRKIFLTNYKFSFLF